MALKKKKKAAEQPSEKTKLIPIIRKEGTSIEMEKEAENNATKVNHKITTLRMNLSGSEL